MVPPARVWFLDRVKLGLALPQYGPLADASRIASFAAAAERMGFHSLWVGDRLLTPLAPHDPYPAPRPQPYPPEFTRGLDPLLTLTVAATATSRVRLSSSTLNAPWHNAVLLARSLTSLDVLSAGRLDVGVGLGWMRDEYEAAGVDWSTRGARLDEMLDVWRLLWTENPVSFAGRFFRFPESVVDMRPVRPGGPPILLAGMTPPAMERIGRRADGWLMVQGLPPPYEGMLWDTARRAADAAGRDPDALRRVRRINRDYPAAVETAGVEEAFVDLTYSTGSVDEALSVAADLAGLL
jgi:probable F420-dependent oxidoreductase